MGLWGGEEDLGGIEGRCWALFGFSLGLEDKPEPGSIFETCQSPLLENDSAQPKDPLLSLSSSYRLHERIYYCYSGKWAFIKLLTKINYLYIHKLVHLSTLI